jgi:ankyrin repeat protein
MEFLLAKGADVNAANKRRSTPLYWAIDNEAKVRLLIEHGADVNAKTVEGRTPVYQAAMLGDGTGVLQLLLDKGGAADTKTLTGMTPLMVAAGRANVEAMRLLIRNKADVNARNSAGSTVLMDAAQTGSVEAVRMLLDKGIDVNAKTKKNETALAYAATAGVEENVKLLLDRGAEVNVRDIRGYSPLLYAAGSDARPAGIVKMLLAKGADTKAEGDGETAAMLAAKRGNTAVASLLQAPESAHKMTDILAVKDTKAQERSITDAVRPALALLEMQSRNFIRIGGCNSCHGQDLPSAAAGLARDHGLPAPKEIPQLPQYMHVNTPERLMDMNTIGANGIGLSWELFDFGMNHVARDEYTDAVVHYLTSVQWPEGNWRANQSRRPPMSTGEYQATALAIYAIRQYGRPQDEARNGKAIARAAAWLERSHPTDTQDRAFRLMGLVWSDASARTIAGAKNELANMQRADGGWSQFPTMESDAYASGEALFALNGGGVAATDAVYRKGVAYLLNTQAEDGSWHVNTRSIWLQPYFESGFPYGHDQWISAAGTAWATMALSVTVNGPDNTRKLAAK